MQLWVTEIIHNENSYLPILIRLEEKQGPSTETSSNSVMAETQKQNMGTVEKLQ